MIEISREFSFEAAHFLPQTPAEHMCHRVHGHTWVVEVWLTGPLDPVKGWIIDYGVLDTIWQAHIDRVIDHRLLNDIIPNPTTENIVQWIYVQLVPPLKAYDCWPTRIVLLEGRENRTMLTISRAGKGNPNGPPPKAKTHLPVTEGMRESDG